MVCDGLFHTSAWRVDMWAALAQSADGLNRTKRCSDVSSQLLCTITAPWLPWVQPASSHCRFLTHQPYNHMSQFLIMNIFSTNIYTIHTSDWFCFSGETGLIIDVRSVTFLKNFSIKEYFFIHNYIIVLQKVLLVHEIIFSCGMIHLCNFLPTWQF